MKDEKDVVYSEEDIKIFKKMSSLTIVLMTRNRPVLVEKAIESILNQTEKKELKIKSSTSSIKFYTDYLLKLSNEIICNRELLSNKLKLNYLNCFFTFMFFSFLISHSLQLSAQKGKSFFWRFVRKIIFMQML
mgnify:CR=1 FL=1